MVLSSLLYVRLFVVCATNHKNEAPWSEAKLTFSQVLDECDNMTVDAQAALRRVIEDSTRCVDTGAVSFHKEDVASESSQAAKE